MSLKDSLNDRHNEPILSSCLPLFESYAKAGVMTSLKNYIFPIALKKAIRKSRSDTSLVKHNEVHWYKRFPDAVASNTCAIVRFFFY